MASLRNFFRIRWRFHVVESSKSRFFGTNRVFRGAKCRSRGEALAGTGGLTLAVLWYYFRRTDSKESEWSFSSSLEAKCEAAAVTQGKDSSGALFNGGHFTVTEDFNQIRIPITTAITHARELCSRRKDETGAPGMTIAVSVDGEVVYTEGFGYADVEQRVKCVPDTVMRIASISKSMTMAMAAKLMEEGKLDLDKPVQDYVKYFPEKSIDGEKVVITTRHLVSHLGGIRHYEKKKFDESNEETSGNKRSVGTNTKVADEFQLPEYYLKENFKSVEQSVKLFKDDELMHKPGEKFLYTTHGWTLVSAVIEAAAGKPFAKLAEEYFHLWGMRRTFLDENAPIIYGRSRQAFFCSLFSFVFSGNYVKDSHGVIKNAPYVDNSYKWAGGGFLSSAGDLVKFGNSMLYCYQTPDQLFGKITSQWPEGISEAVDSEVVVGASRTDKGQLGQGRLLRHGNTGGAIGASSVLLILPDYDVPDLKTGSNKVEFERAPRGVVVAILVNTQNVGLNGIANEIARVFYLDAVLTLALEFAFPEAIGLENELGDLDAVLTLALEFAFPEAIGLENELGGGGINSNVASTPG
ncbi:unnamed protein product [Notodromas monacha]|uniref:Beta-lactamase-related domain-containing protein n=1 Tax=Notodromas monacha TaxID=399045 RepID=A0A7R9BT25_9CRUS|nr:unnamed protein product [Notodromas monacha]CAG0921231.1 unnamed protein product [Notodromas monacha]